MSLALKKAVLNAFILSFCNSLRRRDQDNKICKNLHSILKKWNKCAILPVICFKKLGLTGEKMKLLTRAEELILLAIWQLQEEAYSLPIRELVSKLSGEEWSLGSIYMPLDRLSKRNFVKSYLSDSTPERGGRQKRIYELSKQGKEALIKVKEVQDTMWQNVNGLAPEKK